MLLLVLAGAVATLLPLPWGLGALGFTLAALVVGSRAMTRSAPGTPKWPFALGLLAVTILTMVAGLRMTFYPVQAELERCVDSAITEQARQECTTSMQRTLEQWTGGR
ncbi:MAG: hypothetical protein ACK5MT_19520 [Actinomycetales bacterium]